MRPLLQHEPEGCLSASVFAFPPVTDPAPAGSNEARFKQRAEVLPTRIVKLSTSALDSLSCTLSDNAVQIERRRPAWAATNTVSFVTICERIVFFWLLASEAVYPSKPHMRLKLVVQRAFIASLPMCEPQTRRAPGPEFQ